MSVSATRSVLLRLVQTLGICGHGKQRLSKALLIVLSVLLGAVSALAQSTNEYPTPPPPPPAPQIVGVPGAGQAVYNPQLHSIVVYTFVDNRPRPIMIVPINGRYAIDPRTIMFFKGRFLSLGAFGESFYDSPVLNQIP